ncbi:MAG: hypothetical protein ABEJ26_10320 [Halosimplex sp.]
MDSIGDPGRVVRRARANAAVAWVLLAAVAALAVAHALAGRYLWVGFAAAVLALALVPPLAFGDARAMLPWEVLVLAVVPLTGQAVVPAAAQALAVYLAVAALALVVAVELHLFTTVRMTDEFAVVFVVVATLAAAGSFAVVQWLSDLFLGTAFVPGLRALMLQFTGATVVGVASGVAFTLYFRRSGAGRRRYAAGSSDSSAASSPATPRTSRPSESRSTGETRSPPSAGRSRPASPSSSILGERFGVSERRQRGFVRALQFALAGLLALGVVRLDVGVVVNSAAALAVTQLPAILERDYRLSMDPALALWVATAVFVHAVGIYWSYDAVVWWDHVAHALSASVVAAVGYVAVRAVDEHSDAIYVPPRLLAAFVVLFVVAAGVLWEVIEFLTAELARAAGAGDVLVQYGLEDTMLDLVFDLLGGLVVALWGSVSLAGPVESLTRWLDRRRDG